MQASNQPAKTRQEMATEYAIDVSTLHRWLKKAGIKLNAGRVTPAEQDLIYRKFGDPRGKPTENG